MFKTLSSFLLLAVCSINAFSADPPHPKLRAASSQEVYAAYWTLEPGWHTDIEVRNNIADTPVTVTPTLRFATGSEVVLAPVTISPQDVAMINLHEELAKVAPQLAGVVGSYGSVVLRYSSAFQKNIYAGSMVHYEGKPIAFHFDAWGEEDMMDEGTRESLWWLPNSTTDEHLVVSNVGTKASQLTVTIFDGAGKPYSQRLVLPPRQTRRFSIRELVTANGITDTLGGLTVSVDKGSEAVFTANLSFDTSTGFSALMKTFEDSPKEEVHSVELRAPMLALSNPDPALTLPAGTELEPRIFLRNTTNAPLAIKGELRWRTADTKGLLPLAGLDLAANETRTLDLHAMQKAGKIPPDATWANVKLVYTGRYGDLVPIAASYDHDLSHGLQTPFTDIVSSHWVGSQWHADSLRHSLITAGNATDKQLTVQFTLHYNGGKGKYELEQTLPPGDQMFVDVAKIIRTQAPDMNGTPIPVDVTSGSYSFRDKDKALGQSLYEGKLTIDQKYGFASYGCGGCCDPTAAELWPNPFGGIPGNTWGNNVIGFNPCDNMSYDLTANAFSWLSGNTSVLTISAPTSTAVGPGTTFLGTSIMVPKQHILRCIYEQTNPSSTGNVYPTVTIDAPTGVPKGASGGFEITIGSNPNGVTMNFTLTTTSGTGDATFNDNTHSLNLSSSAMVAVKGVTESSTANNITIKALDPRGVVVASKTFSVVWVTLSIRKDSGTDISGDNAGRFSYQFVFHHKHLGSFPNPGDNGCKTGVEMIGTVAPTNYTGSVVLLRKVLSYGLWDGSSLVGTVTTPFDDPDSTPSLRDDDPQSESSNGKVYDLDAPGSVSVPSGHTYRVRHNLSFVAVLDSPTNSIPVSSTLGWYAAESCTNTGGVMQLETSVANDNSAGTGTVHLSWDLQ